jgi:hypothetical protein
MKEECGFAHHAYLVGVKAVVLIEHNVSSQTSARSSLANELLNNFNAALTDYNRTTPASSGP